MNKSLLLGTTLACALTVGCGNNSTSRIEFAGENSGGQIWFDANSVRSTDSFVLVNAEVRNSKSDPINVRFAENGSPLLTVATSTMQIDCKGRSYKSFKTTQHLSDGEVVTLPDKDHGLIRPGSPIEKIADYACLPEWRRALSR